MSIFENVFVLYPELTFLKRLIQIGKKAEVKTLDDLEDGVNNNFKS